LTEPMHEETDRARDFLYLFSLLMLIWLALTSSFHWQELAVGILISLVLSLILHRNYQVLGLPPLSLKRVAFAVIYIVVLFREIILANIDVAYRIIHPKMPIRPGIVMIKTTLKQDFAKLILANSITLTPGTFTLDIHDDTLLVHWINVRSEETEEATTIIGRRFEKYLKVIFS
jgi:multicomponent Na+:H+ antiporter subunit E